MNISIYIGGILALLFIASCSSFVRFTSENKDNALSETIETREIVEIETSDEKLNEDDFIGDTFTGIASFYADKFHGRKTSSGEIFDQQDYTAAHKTLPFGSRLLVTNLDNNKSVVVRVNDRGPFVKGRIIDLSRAAAEELDMIELGIVEVEIRVLK